MLNVRHIFRLFKQSPQCTLGRPSLLFSSNADDSNSKRPPNKEDGEIESLDALLNATYSNQKLPKSPFKNGRSSPVKSLHKRVAKSTLSAVEQVSIDGSRPAVLDKRDQGDVPLEKLLSAAHHHTGKFGTNAESHKKISVKSGGASARPIDLAIKKKKDHVTSAELLDRIRKIAEEVSGAAGPKANEVAEDLMRKLQTATKAKEKPLDFNELTFEDHSRGGSDQNLDLLRNKIVSEEQIYKITPGPRELLQGRENSQTQMEFREPWPERVRRINIGQDLDVSLYPKKGIGIFKPEPKENQRTKSCLSTYERLEQRELNLSHSYAPRNWFEQCIQWTEQGKLWHFPINNEQGLEEAASISFTDHVFLEDHLEGWCPTFGPLRHFMELVCLGLSKNPYLTVEEKIDTILWYRDYFEQHRDIMEAAGTLDSGVTKVPVLEAQ